MKFEVVVVVVLYEDPVYWAMYAVELVDDAATDG
jgi:hypothetical protein